MTEPNREDHVDPRKEETVPLPAADGLSSSLGSTSLFEVRQPAQACPERIGRYRILKILGQGGMGTVYLAAQVEPVQRQVALKVVKHGMGDREFVLRFELERQALALMNHPSVARVFDAGATEDGRPYFVMELVSGLPITEYCDRDRLSIRERLELFLQVCRGVQHAHTKAIIHRDIKPSNVLVTVEGDKPVPKIIDFGIAKTLGPRLTRETLLTVQGQIVGTPEYMSPEQADPSSEDVDTRTDVYSLGVLLYELLTGEIPFDSAALRKAGVSDIARIIREVEPPRPSARVQILAGQLEAVAKKRRTEPGTLVRELRGDLDWVTLKAMEKDRNQRYATVQELAADILRHLSHDPVLARPPSVTYRLRKLLRKHRGKVGAALVLLAFATVFTAGSWLLAYRDRIAQSEGLRSRAEESLKVFRELKVEELACRKALLETNEGKKPWQPVWERLDEIHNEKRLRALREDLSLRYGDAVFALQKALQVAPKASSEHLLVRRAVQDLAWEQYRDASADGGVTLSPDFFKKQIEEQGSSPYDGELQGSSVVTLQTDPPGAEVRCYRFEESEGRLLPLPFDWREPRVDPAGRPFLQVERIWEGRSDLFQPGDRLLEVHGRRISLMEDLADALKGLGTAEEVDVKLDRSGKEVRLRWAPFRPATCGEDADPDSPLQPGRLVEIRRQLGIALAGYPLETLDSCRVREEGKADPLRLELPRGSYLFLFRKEGHVDARLPVAIPSLRGAHRVTLFREDERLKGYVHIPAGPVPYGGDAAAYQALDGGVADVPDFLMARFEVTFGEYLDFLNDPAVLRETDPETGTAPHHAAWEEDLTEWTVDELRQLGLDGGRIQLVPTYLTKSQERALLYEYDGATSRWTLPDKNRDLPLMGLPVIAGLEYARWLTEKAGGPWRFRLPRDLEWEKAARGADRRIHVWGDTLQLSFCKSAQGSYTRDGYSRLEPVGCFPLDESVYGVRDMAGSVSEPTLSRADPNLQHCSVRGGSWTATDPRDFRVATRNRRLLQNSHNENGLRLVAEPRRTGR